MTVKTLHTEKRHASDMPMMKRTVARPAKLLVAAVQHIMVAHTRAVAEKNLATGKRWMRKEEGYSKRRNPK